MSDLEVVPSENRGIQSPWCWQFWHNKDMVGGRSDNPKVRKYSWRNLFNIRFCDLHAEGFRNGNLCPAGFPDFQEPYKALMRRSVIFTKKIFENL